MHVQETDLHVKTGRETNLLTWLDSERITVNNEGSYTFDGRGDDMVAPTVLRLGQLNGESQDE